MERIEAFEQMLSYGVCLEWNKLRARGHCTFSGKKGWKEI